MSFKDDSHITTLHKDETIIPYTYQVYCVCGWKSGTFLLEKIAVSAGNVHRTIKKVRDIFQSI